MKEIKIFNSDGSEKGRLDIEEQKKKYAKMLSKNPSDEQLIDVLNYVHSYTEYELVDKKDE